MIQACLRIVPPVDKWLELRDVMRALKGPTEWRRMPCCRVLQEDEADGGLTYFVQWESLGQLEEHVRSARFRKLLPYIEMSSNRRNLTCGPSIGSAEWIRCSPFLARSQASASPDENPDQVP